MIYPLLGVFVVWLLGGEGALAGITLLPADQPIGRRVLAVGLLGLLGLLSFLFFKDFRSEGWRSLNLFIGRCRCRCRIYPRPAALRTTDRPLLARVQCRLCWHSVLVLAWVLSRAENPEPLLLPVFLILLPLTNAFLDRLSLGFTRGFFYAIGYGHHKCLVALSFAGPDGRLGRARVPPFWRHIVAGKIPALRWSVLNDQLSGGSCRMSTFCPLPTDN